MRGYIREDYKPKGIYDFGCDVNQIYESECDKCGFRAQVSTQRDLCPEYYTDVYILCPKCKNSIPFTLPVN